MSEDSDFAYLPAPPSPDSERRRGARPARGPLAPHLELVKARGRLVRCGPLGEDDAVAWVVRAAVAAGVESGMREAVARHLLDRVGGDLWVARSVCLKLGVFAGSPTRDVIDVLTPAGAGDDFVTALLAADRPGAFRAAGSVHPSEHLKVIGTLEARLDVLAKLHPLVRARRTLKDVAASGEVPVFLAKSLMPVAASYDRGKRERCRGVLAQLDEAVRSGVRIGVLESAVALW